MGGMNLRLPFVVSLGLFVTACGSFDGTVDGAGSDGGAVLDATADANPQDGSTVTDSGTPLVDGGTPQDSGVVVDAGTPNATLCAGLAALGNGDFANKSESGSGAFSRTGNTYRAELTEDAPGQAFLPTKSLLKSKVCVSVDVDLNVNADKLSATYQLIGGQIGLVDVAQLGAVVNSNGVAIAYKGGATALMNVGTRRTFRLELLLENTVTGSKLRYRGRGTNGSLIGEGELSGNGGSGIVVQAGVGCANAGGSVCKKISVDGTNFGVFTN